MLRSAPLLALFVAVLFTGSSFSAVLEIALPVVSPTSPQSIQVLPFEIGIPLENVQSIALRLEGTFNDQFFLCGSVPYDFITAPSRVGIALGDDVLESQDVQIIHEFPANPGDPLAFEFTETLLEGPMSNWPFLADGSSQLGLFDSPRTVWDENNLVCGPGNVFGTLSGATLVVTYSGNVPTATKSWDTIKSLYR